MELYKTNYPRKVPLWTDERQNKPVREKCKFSIELNDLNVVVLMWIFIFQANDTLETMNRLKIFLKSVDTVIKQLRVPGEFQDKFMNIVKLAKSPFVQLMLANFNVDSKLLDTIFDALLHDKQTAEIVATVANIFECFSVDRFVGVNSEEELEDLAVVLNDQKLFYAAVYFENDGHPKQNEIAYKIRVDSDNTPGTLENRNRFWFPGPNGNFELNMRYHRGFIQIQHIVDQAIIKSTVDIENARQEIEWKRTTTTSAPPTTTEEDSSTDNNDFSDSNDNESATDKSETDESTTVASGELNDSKAAENETLTSQQAEDSNEEAVNATTTTPETVLNRKKRQFDFFGDLFGNKESKSAATEEFKGIEIGDMKTYTKQFPYPKYRKDDFLTGLYLAQAIQMVFFFALIIQVTNAVRNRIWMKESGNSTVSFAVFFMLKVWGLTDFLFSVDENHGFGRNIGEHCLDFVHIYRFRYHIFDL